MPRIGLVSAIFISIALIGGALWFRFVRIPPYSADLASLQKIEQKPSGDTLLENFYNDDAALAVASTTPIKETDQIGRQLFSDYFSLKSQGTVSSSSINALASKYAESIANFGLSVQKVNQSQILVLPDSEANLTAYGNTMANIRNKYKNIVASQVREGGSKIAAIGSPTFSAFMSTVGKLYKSSADELLVVKVPTTLAENHLNLINNYLEIAKALEIFSDPSNDPRQAYTALNVYVKNSAEESKLLLNIQKVMMANGIILESSI